MKKATTTVRGFLILLLTVAVFGTGMVGCKTQKEASKTSSVNAKDDGPKGKTKITEKQRLDAEYIFFNAAKEGMLGNYDEAARLYNQSLVINPYNAAAFYELARIAFEKRDTENALLFARAAIALDKKNVWYKLLYANVLQSDNKPDEAVKIFEQLSKDNPNSLDYAYNLADAYLKASRPHDAIKALDKIESLMGLTPEISEEKQRIYLRLGDINKAANEIQKLIDNSPNDPTYYLILADMYLTNRMNDKAIEQYDKILKIDPDNGPVHYSLSQYYRDKGDKTKSYEELKLAFKSPQVDIDTKLLVLQSYLNISDRDTELNTQAYELLKIVTDAHPTEAKAYSIYADFLMRDKKLSEARDMLKKVIELDDSKYTVWYQLILAESELKDYDGVYQHSTKALELFPTQPALYLMKGMAAIQLKKNKEAIEVLQDGSGLVFNNNALEVQFYATLGDAFNSEKDYDKSDAFYDKALALEPQNTYVLNNYTYFLTLRKAKLSKAREMGRLINVLEPNVANYQDTYAWVFYQMGEYNDARTWLEKALSNGGEDNSTILEHYGDVMFKLGDNAKALEYWKKAKEKGEDSDTLDKKIAEKRLIEQP